MTNKDNMNTSSDLSEIDDEQVGEELEEQSSDLEQQGLGSKADLENEEEEEEDDDDDEEDDEEDEEEEEEEDDDIPNSSDEEDNYKVEDPDEIDEDLELADEYEDEDEYEAPKKGGSVKATDRSRTTKTKVEAQKPLRETRKRRVPLDYDEDDEGTLDESSPAPSHPSQPSRKQRKGTSMQPQEIDQDLLLTDEESEYNPNANPDISKMTERQRTRYLEQSSDTPQLVALDNSASSNKRSRNKKKDVDAEQVALRKAESSRKRQDYKNKQLEEEKRDTVNKLLKRRANKTREVDSKEGSVDVFKRQSVPVPSLNHPALRRYVSNTTTLNGNSLLAIDKLE